jgi:hypothetical protein
LDEHLAADLFDWRSLYVQIQTAGITDPHYHWSNFGNVTIDLINEVIKSIAERDMDMANSMSISTSRMACLMLNSQWFGGKFDIKDFIPFVRDVDNKPSDNNAITRETAIAFRKAMKDNWLPNKVIAASSNYMDDIAKLSVGEK